MAFSITCLCILWSCPFGWWDDALADNRMRCALCCCTTICAVCDNYAVIVDDCQCASVHASLHAPPVCRTSLSTHLAADAVQFSEIHGRIFSIHMERRHDEGGRTNWSPPNGWLAGARMANCWRTIIYVYFGQLNELAPGLRRRTHTAQSVVNENAWCIRRWIILSVL